MTDLGKYNNIFLKYKLIDDNILELSKRLKFQAQQESLTEAWKPYIKDPDTVYTDASATKVPCVTQQTQSCYGKA